MATVEKPSANLTGLRVAAFESRRADDMARLIERHGGVPCVSPSMREVPLGDRGPIAEFARSLVAGQIDVVIFMTGVGFRHLLQGVEALSQPAAGDDAAASGGPATKDVPDKAKFLAALANAITLARGPKPVAAMKEVGLAPTHRVPEPNTWREVLALLDVYVPLAGKTVAVQEYGQPNPHLQAGLAARGAKVLPLHVYRWDLPLDTAPLEANVRALAAGERDAVMFTSAHQIVNVLSVAERLGLADEMRRQLSRVVVASIGPTTSEMLRELLLPVDLEPEHSKMGQLVAALAEKGVGLVAAKCGTPHGGGTPCKGVLPTSLTTPFQGVPPKQGAPPSHNSPFMKACRREPTEFTPIWLMRQAGRYLPEYRQFREKIPFLELCKNPQLSAELMVRTVERLGVDAAIIFSDLLPILEPMGLDLEFQKGEGPVIHNPVRAAGDVDRVAELESVEALSFVMETVRATRAGLAERIPVIGFAGAPFTLASYVIEGGASRDYLHTKTLMYRDEGAWNSLLSRLSRAVTRYLNAQVEAGAQAVQIFDSWVGCLGPDDYRRYVLPHLRAVIEGVLPGTPVIHFATGNPALLPLRAEAGGAVIGVDWRVRLDDAWRTIGNERAIQGNLDPAVLLADRKYIRAAAEEILRQAAGRPGHIFNLGHGVLPQTPPENVMALVEMVHEMSAREG
ncbi:MAG: uroporphyrinogen decarboxylase [Planctomycetia bacterium]|nr:uroporphyrinogen decarboxylase [Planctomycetia bacterium]